MRANVLYILSRSCRITFYHLAPYAPRSLSRDLYKAIAAFIKVDKVVQRLLAQRFV